MNNYIFPLTLAGLIGMTGASPLPAMAMAEPVKQQTAAPNLEAQKPNFNGVWARYPSPFPEDLPEEADTPVPEPGPNLKEPYASQWKAHRAHRQAMLEAGTPLLDESTLCLPEGMPMVMYAIYPIEIFQADDRMVVLAELFMQTRRIHINKPFPAPDDLEPNYFGFSSAHWEGQDLVVVTKGVSTDVKIFEIPHSDKMVITERFRFTGTDIMTIDFKIEDPEYLVTPYQYNFIYKRDHTYNMPEYICDSRVDQVNDDGTVEMKTNL